MRGGFRNFPRREPRPEPMGTSNGLNAVRTNASGTNPVVAGEPGPPPPPPEGGFMPPPGERPDQPREGEPRPRRPFWARDLNDRQYQDMVASRELHGLVLTLSTESLQAVIAP